MPSIPLCGPFMNTVPISSSESCTDLGWKSAARHRPFFTWLKEDATGRLRLQRPTTYVSLSSVTVLEASHVLPAVQPVL